MQDWMPLPPSPHPLAQKKGPTPMSREFPKNPEPQKIAPPTVGRIVLFKSQASAPAVPAIVVSVVDGSHTIHHLTVFTTSGPEGYSMVRHASEKAGEYTPTWDWMDYQKGQAAKTEALEAQLKEAYPLRAVHDTELGKLQAGAPSPVDGKR